jgi:UDP-N-acetylmuramoylalanine--D-glutamate ligase
MLTRLEGRRLSVVGLGKSGLASALFLKRRGAHVFATETQENEATLAARAELEGAGVEVELGRHSLDRTLDADCIVISPGISPKTVIYQTVHREKPGGVVSEIELASWFCRSQIVAVTGTNGKTTTTTLLADMFRHFGVPAEACGNIGLPFVSIVERLGVDAKAVVEVSSFQLENIRHFHPHVACLLNLKPDHFDWHGSMTAYREAKAKIFQNQDSEDFAVLNKQDLETRAVLPAIRSRILYFNEGEVENPNWDAVLRVARIYGFPQARVLERLRSVPPIPHRLERVASDDGLIYVNDSKSTNPDSLEWALARMSHPVVLICGGRNKGNDFRPLAPLVQRKVKSCIVIGEARLAIQQAWQGVVPTEEAPDLEQAVRKARSLAQAGETVLLSPGCASFDMFRNFEDRGSRFKSIVSRLAEESQEVLP